jgi:hypothetical protein
VSNWQAQQNGKNVQGVQGLQGCVMIACKNRLSFPFA